ncbi:MAG: ABC transporter ATP-binding protein [Candidatus Contendobacter sp.]|nr:ABC transporter ATP-binding protein [Candidatus Contendobacter sp.]MDG4556737.1 ABC transporter ATP-binding protein [Candidatus Contendobacter sp.]
MRILDHINLEFCEGEMVCLLGPSGCGKSTLLRLIAGFDMTTAGEVVIDGRKVVGPSPNHIFVFQHSGLLPWMTVWQNVELGVRNVEDLRTRQEKVQENIDMVDLTDFEQHYPHQLSGGMKRRAELARALAANPDVLIMDEPFNGLDFLSHMRIREEIVNMHELLRKTTLVVTHDIDDALLMGDRIVVMGGRPAQIKLNRQLDFPHPRDPKKNAALGDLRDELFLMLGVSYAV